MLGLKLNHVSKRGHRRHYDDVTMGGIASQITSLTIVYSTVYSGADQRKHQSSASLAFVWGIHRGPVNSLHKWPVTRKMFPFDDVIMDKSHFFSLPGPHFNIQCHEDLKPWDLYLELTDRSEIWQAPWQQCCLGASLISEGSYNSKYKSHHFETLWDLIIRRLIVYGNGALQVCYCLLSQ